MLFIYSHSVVLFCFLVPKRVVSQTLQPIPRHDEMYGWLSAEYKPHATSRKQPAVAEHKRGIVKHGDCVASIKFEQ